MPFSYPLLEKIAFRAKEAPESVAVISPDDGREVAYGQLYADVCRYADELEKINGGDLKEARVGLLIEKGYKVVVALLSVWAAGGLALPCLTALPLPEHSYMLQNASAGLIIHDSKNAPRAEALQSVFAESKCRLLVVPDFAKAPSPSGLAVETLEKLGGDRKAMMLYTSGTTGRPKGVVTRHSALASQVSAIVECWRWSSSVGGAYISPGFPPHDPNNVIAQDLLLHVLPLNHLHGIVVALLTTLWAGAGVELWSKLDGEKIWRRWINEETARPITMFFGVPTVYTRMIQAHALLSPDVQPIASQASSKLRLQVSGSAPLPESVKQIWDNGVGGKGQVLLERYGMTEMGIGLSTGWDAARRIGGHVGFPLSNTELRLISSETHDIITAPEEPGEIQIRGPGIFNEYWGLPEATAKEFEKGGWFKTGDVGCLSGEKGMEGAFKVLGRSSVDIIKSGGEKISALDVERALLELDYIKDAAVVGLENEEWGQIVAAVVVSSLPDLTLEKLRKDLKSKVAVFKIPKALKVYDEIPRNTMGKINKKSLVKEAFD